MNDLPSELIKIIALLDIRVYFTIVLTCKRFNAILWDKIEVMDGLAREKMISTINSCTRQWELRKGMAHRGNDLPAFISHTITYDAVVFTYLWFKCGVPCERANGEANSITFTDKDNGAHAIAKYWFNSNLVFSRPHGLPCIETIEGCVLTRREWHKSITEYKVQDHLGMFWYENKQLVKYDTTRTIKNTTIERQWEKIFSEIRKRRLDV